MLAPFAGATAPTTGWLLCAGQAVSRTTYAALFAVTSTAYGSGDGSTTFNLPDLRGRVVAAPDNMGGTDAGRLDWADTRGTTGGAQTLPLHTHDINHNHGAHTTEFAGTHSHLWRWNETGGGANDYNPEDAGVGVQGGVMFGVDTSSSQTKTYAVQVDNDGNHQHTYDVPELGTTQSGQTGTGTHGVMQPTILLNYIIKY
jgi:microcystin-dependent protein